MSRNIVFILLLFSVPVFADELDEFLVNSKKLVENYSIQLQNKYDHAYALQQPAAVAEVCRSIVTTINNNPASQGWIVRRTSLEVLNKENTPDVVEKKTLQDFNKKKAEGRKVEQLAWYKLSEAGNQSEFRYIKGFEREQRCMECHHNAQNEMAKVPGLYALSLQKIETKDYFPEPAPQEQDVPLPDFEE